MRITSLTLQAFRGFNDKEEFSFESVDIIILYGPNGHGKSSIYDAIEWGLTGGIYRFEEASPERKRTRFIRNLHADSTVKSFVKIGIILSNEQRYFIERECTASPTDRTDYGKYKLKIFDENDHLYKKDNEAEETLKSWLIHEEWLPKISSPTTMLSLTHILSQEKIAEFLRGMQERDRYDKISTIFGTDNFDKYREGFRIVRNTLNSGLDSLKVRIKEKNLLKEKIYKEVKELESKVEVNQDSDFNAELENYITIYPESIIYKDDLGKLLSFIISNIHKNKIEQEEVQREYQVLKEIKEELPNLSYIRNVHKDVIRENVLLQRFKKVSLTKLKIDQLLNTEKIVTQDKEMLKSLISSQKESILRVDSLLDKKSNLQKLNDSIYLHLDNFSWKNGISFLSELKLDMTEENLQILSSAFKCLHDEFQFIEGRNSNKQDLLVQSKSLEESIEKIMSTDKLYNIFLSSLNEYILVLSEEVNSCPACGTEGVKKKDILDNVYRQQLKINENLPSLEKLQFDAQSKMKIIEEEIHGANNRINESRKKIEDVVLEINNSIKTLNIKISTEKENQKTLQQKIDSIQIRLNQFENDCNLLGINIEDNIKGKLEIKNQALLDELIEINDMRLSEFKSGNFLPQDLRVEKFTLSEIDDYEHTLRQLIDIQETEINRVNRLAMLSERISIDIKTGDLKEIEDSIAEEIKVLNEKLNKFSELENSSLKLQGLIELNSEKMRLIKAQNDLEGMKNEIVKLENQETKMNSDLANLLTLMNKSTEALSNLNEKVFENLKETIQTIFEQINSHPIFTKLDLTMDQYRNNNCLTINVYKDNSENEIKANAPYVFSSAQVNSIALSLFLAMSLKQKWSPLQLIGMDDPIQSMDEVNVISFIDLMRLFVDKHKKQIIISTHDQSFYKLILKKFRYYNISTVEYEVYGDKGPTLKIPPVQNNKIERELSYERAKDALIRLDMKD
ncbi:SMC family ATPase [Mesobacillus subterraneus]|uniref:AAA family ATPase n=1 Tax=Mesobacillus subterraneus TaxID=285983 RepID=UPI00203C4B2E|nr:SMC family ATPase [Mesobacillus subterraneus]MCM3576453.1 SMC family ATPase [Mesobacillus subterraneus]